MIVLFNFAGSGDSGEESIMKDQKTLAYINLFAILGALPYLCDLDKKSAQLIENASVSVGFAVKGGPAATLFFGGGHGPLPGKAALLLLREVQRPH